MTGEPDGGGLWSWAQAAYERPGAKSLLLDGQDRLGLDVCVLLWLFWREAEGRPADADEIAAARAVSAAFQAPLVAEIRSVRRVLRATDEAESRALSDALLAAELAAERLELSALEAIARSNGETSQAAVAGAAARLHCYIDYCAAKSPETEAWASDLLAVLVS